MHNKATQQNMTEEVDKAQDIEILCQLVGGKCILEHIFADKSLVWQLALEHLEKECLSPVVPIFFDWWVLCMAHCSTCGTYGAEASLLCGMVMHLLWVLLR